MKTQDNSTTISLKTKKDVKALAQMRAQQLGIPLGTIVNAFLRNFGQTGEIHFTVAEPITPKMKQIIEQMRADIADSETYGPFSIDDAETFLDSVQDESEHKN